MQKQSTWDQWHTKIHRKHTPCTFSSVTHNIDSSPLIYLS
jgi:hypothetical protein